MNEHLQHNSINKNIRVYEEQRPTAFPPATSPMVLPTNRLIPVTTGIDHVPQSTASFPANDDGANTSTPDLTQDTSVAESPPVADASLSSWEVAFKLPDSKVIHTCSDNSTENLTLRKDVDVNDWLRGKLCVSGSDQWKGWLCYNDQFYKYNETEKDYKHSKDSTCGHCKGILVWNDTHVGWLVHSLPYWPHPREIDLENKKLEKVQGHKPTARQNSTPNQSELEQIEYDEAKGGQLQRAQNLAFMQCARKIGDDDNLKKIVAQIQHMEAYVYMCRGVDKSNPGCFQDWNRLMNKKVVPQKVPSDIEGYLCTTAKEAKIFPIPGFNGLTHIAKSSAFGDDIYTVCLPEQKPGSAPWYARTHLIDHSKKHNDDSDHDSDQIPNKIKMQKEIPLGNIEIGGQMIVRDIVGPFENIPGLKQQQWKYTMEHSKWAYSSCGEYVFVGDLNRSDAQMRRGGGGFLLQHSGLNKHLKLWGGRDESWGDYEKKYNRWEEYLEAVAKTISEHNTAKAKPTTTSEQPTVKAKPKTTPVRK